LEQLPKALPVSAFLDGLGLVLAPCPGGKPSCSPLQGKWSQDSAGWSTSSVLVPGSLLSSPLLSSPCAPRGRWPQCRLAMAPGLPDTFPLALRGCRGRAGGAGVGAARVAGGHGWGCAPAHHHLCGLKESTLGSHGQGSCMAPAVQLAPPLAPPFPARQIQETSSADICFALSPARSFF